MAKCLFSLFLVLALASAFASGARNIPGGLSDQKNYLGYGGGYSGIGDNGLPFGGVGGVCLVPVVTLVLVDLVVLVEA
ncbi:hypothetical protein Bca52824_089151 [Brassica carinata]|uniref:Glycine-rich protein n=1 Tax=Brassica carinata TaxID=52824 RepID=A0A8X7PER4_BRACI|nr:hypothetical protein Bca52824_089151 [Brassica carinata]